MNSKELRHYFLKQGKDLIDLQLDYSRKFKSISQAQKQAFDVLGKILVETSDLQKINAGSTQQVILLLGKGKVSVDEALKLMELLRTQQEVELAPEMLKQLKKLNKK